MSKAEYLEILVPQENVNDEHVRVTEWHCKDGDRVTEGAVIVALETSKTNFDLTAERSGVIHYSADDGEDVPVGALLATIGNTDDRPPVWSSTQERTAENSPEQVVTTKAKKLMKEHGLTQDVFQGLDRITASDVLTRAGQHPKTQNAWQAPTIPAKRVEISWRKAHEIRLLSIAASGVIPSSVTLPVDTVCVDEVIDNASQELGVGITRGEWISFCVSRVLAKHPRLNGYYDDGVRVLYQEQHVGYAMNLGEGLKVPVIRKAEKKDLKAVSVAIKDFALQYMRGELLPSDLSQPTFSVTDLGGVGVTHFLPVLPAGQAAILGVCAPMPGASAFNLVLTFDHRMADGMEAAGFLQALRSCMLETHSQ